MILDTLANASLYQFKNADLPRGLEYLRGTGLASVPLGKHVIDDRLYVVVQEYETKLPAESFWESHRKNIDIQYVVSGVEQMGHALSDRLQITERYDPAKDITKYAGTGGETMLTLSAGQFAIFFPHDAHLPGLAPGGKPGPVRKVVVKVAVG